MIRLMPAACAIAIVICLAASAGAAQLLSHRALYRVSLGGDAGRIQDATGAAAMDLERTCDGWIISQRMTTDMAVGDDQTLRMETRFAGWESMDHQKYRFAVRNSVGDEHETFKGNAEAGSANAPGSVTYTVPRQGKLALPDGVLFPIGHIKRLIDAATAVRQMVSATVFEGSDKVGTRLATTFIRPSASQRSAAHSVTGKFSATRAWTMRTAYFPATGTGSVPDFEVQATQFENGVADDILLDYGEFSVLLTLQSVEALPAPAC